MKKQSNSTCLQNHHCAMVALASANTTHVTPVSNITCSQPRLRKAPGVMQCAKPEDLFVTGACLRFKENQSGISRWPQLHRATSFRLDLRNQLILQFNQKKIVYAAISALFIFFTGRCFNVWATWAALVGSLSHYQVSTTIGKERVSYSWTTMLSLFLARRHFSPYAVSRCCFYQIQLQGFNVFAGIP